MVRFQRLISAIDAHAAGEPLRVVTSGLPPIPGGTILEKRRVVAERYDHLRKLLMLEPRGHSGMYGCLITPPVTDDGDFGVLFMHNEGYSTMCGHGIIAVTKVAIETGLIEAEGEEKTVRIDSPAGRVTAVARLKEGRVAEVSFENVPAFVYAQDIEIEVAGLGNVSVDVAFGGAFYAFVEAKQLKVRLVPEEVSRLVQVGMEIKRQVMDRVAIVHPTEPDLSFLYGTIITGAVGETRDGLISKNVTIFADAQVDRSPTGTGTSARLALMHKKGLIAPGVSLANQSLIETVFWGRITGLTETAGRPAVITEIRGAAQITGFHQFVLEPEDPLDQGFRITSG